MAQVHLDGDSITDWDTFHSVCAEKFGFPDFYGRNMDAWIDCLSYINEGDGMCRFVLEQNELLLIRVANTKHFNERVPDVFSSLVECTAFVNQRLLDAGDEPRLAIVFV